MKNLLCGAAIAALAAPSLAGGIVTPITVIEEETTASSGSDDYVVPLLLAAVILAIIANSSSGGVVDDLVLASDERLKTDIVPTGRSHMGMPIHRFSYVGHPEAVFEGVMAQDVQRVMPEAVHAGSEGFLMVDYGMVGLNMVRIR